MVSSGSTGMPKCSLFSDNNTAVKLRQYAEVANLGSADVAAALAPAGTGSTGYNFPILTMLMFGGTSVVIEHWSADRIDEAIRLIQNHACTYAVAVPAQLAKIVQLEGLSSFDLSHLKLITYAGAKLPPSVAEATEKLLGCVVQSSYGTSEAGSTTMTRADDPPESRHYSVGRPLRGQAVSILDTAGRPVSAGQAGEVCWRGPNKSYGFLNDPDGTRNVWDAEGLFHSGDLGRFDESGNLHITGRIKDMIIRGGQNINPGAIEEILLAHAQISEVAVVGVEDKVLGERIAVCLTLRGSEGPSLQTLKTLVLKQGLAHWNQPELLIVLDELPRNAGGKVDKKQLARIAAESNPN
jgi:non-ribosomal peptide synthetase component E (peptide arylation enzyme)